MAEEVGRVLLDDLGFLLARASAVAVAAGNDALRPLGLTVRAFATLCLAAENDGMTQREISDFLRLDPSRVVAIVDDLEDRGFVARAVTRADRRMKAVIATPAGRELLRKAVAATREAQRAAFPLPTPESRAEATRMLRLLAFPDER
ncbi:MarR family transcriptional regulator [Agromyces sp. NPDC049794]|uniref:MarR family winged helix-turn-helix transcriptional regulator n=1 Tax=unclassified Agromyces TaxID=2639701 RepID=UPI00340362E5